MSAELVAYQPVAPVVRDHQTEAIQRLTEWAASAQAAMVVASELSKSAFVPEQFRNKPAECTAAILAGLEVGLQPIAALRSFDVIQGQAAPRALTLRAVAQSYGHEIEVVESTATRCKVRGRRNGSSNWQEVVWTIDRAKSLKLTGKHNWVAQPQAMLVARATSEMARLIAADAILGIGYSSEELADGAGAGVDVPEITTADPTTPGAATAPAGSRKMSRRKPVDPPPAEDDIADAEVVETEPQPEVEEPAPANDRQFKMMMALLNGAGIKEKDDQIAYFADVIGRTVESRNDLTPAERSQVIDALKAAS